jgi:TonB family protein
MRSIAIGLVVGLGLATCGGGDKKVEAPRESADDDSGGGEDHSDVLVPEEKFDEIKRTFDSKRTMVSRCYVTGVEAGEIDRTAKGHITVGVTVTRDGKASNVRVLQSSLGSKAADDCVVGMVEGWTFTDSLPKPVEHSHTYVMDRF